MLLPLQIHFLGKECTSSLCHLLKFFPVSNSWGTILRHTTGFYLQTDMLSPLCVPPSVLVAAPVTFITVCLSKENCTLAPTSLPDWKLLNESISMNFILYELSVPREVSCTTQIHSKSLFNALMNDSVSEQTEVGWHGWMGWSNNPIYEAETELSFAWP